MSWIQQFLAATEWSAVLGVVNLVVLLTVLRIVGIHQRKHVEVLSALRQSEFVKEIRAYREAYEEREKLLALEVEQFRGKAQADVRRAESAVEASTVHLERVFRELQLKSDQVAALSSALRSRVDAGRALWNATFSHDVVLALSYLSEKVARLDEASRDSHCQSELAKIKSIVDDITVRVVDKAGNMPES